MSISPQVEKSSLDAMLVWTLNDYQYARSRRGIPLYPEYLARHKIFGSGLEIVEGGGRTMSLVGQIVRFAAIGCACAATLDSQAQRFPRPDECFADPTLPCLVDLSMAALRESEYPDPDALLEIGAVLADAGHSDRAVPILMRALDSTMLMGWPEMRGAMFYEAAEMAREQLGTDEARSVLRHAASVARQMELHDIRAMAMQAMAMNEIEAGQFEQARDVLDDALDVVVQVPWEEMRRSQFTMLIDVIVGELPAELARPVFEHALELADDVVDGLGEGVFWADMASAHARLGDIDAALEMADAIRNAAWRSGARIGIAGALAARGELDRAMAMASELDDRRRSRAIAEIALALVDRGAIEAVRDLAVSIDDDYERGNILANVARTALEAGDLDQALTVAAEITNRQTHTLLVIDLVYAFTESEIDDAEKQRLTDALFAARELARDGPGSSTYLPNLVSAFARLGLVDEAFAIIDELGEVDDPGNQTSALSNLASVLASQGDIDRAAEIVNEIESTSDNPYLVGSALRIIAAAHATEGDVDAALALVERIDEPGIRAVALARIAVNLPE